MDELGQDISWALETGTWGNLSLGASGRLNREKGRTSPAGRSRTARSSHYPEDRPRGLALAGLQPRRQPAHPAPALRPVQLHRAQSRPGHGDRRQPAPRPVAEPGQEPLPALFPVRQPHRGPHHLPEHRPGHGAICELRFSELPGRRLRPQLETLGQPDLQGQLHLSGR